MKQKIIIAVLFSFSGFVAYAQNSSADGASGSKQTQTTINGIPYSQYKAEQDALKQQASNKQTPVALYKTSNTGLIDLPVQAKTAAPTQVPDKQITTPVVAAKQEIVQVVEVPVEPNMPMGGNAGGGPLKAFQNKNQETVKIEGTSNDQKMQSIESKTATKPVTTVPVKEKPVVTQSATAPLNINTVSVSGVTEVPAVVKPVKKD